MNNWNIIETGSSRFSNGYYFGNSSVYLLWKNRNNKLTSEEENILELLKKIKEFCDKGNIKYTSHCFLVGKDFIELRYYDNKKINLFYYLFFKRTKNEIIFLEK